MSDADSDRTPFVRKVVAAESCTYGFFWDLTLECGHHAYARRAVRCRGLAMAREVPPRGEAFCESCMKEIHKAADALLRSAGGGDP